MNGTYCYISRGGVYNLATYILCHSHLCTEQRIYISSRECSCSVHKPDWHSTLVIVELREKPFNPLHGDLSYLQIVRYHVNGKKSAELRPYGGGGATPSPQQRSWELSIDNNKQHVYIWNLILTVLRNFFFIFSIDVNLKALHEDSFLKSRRQDAEQTIKLRPASVDWNKRSW